MNGEVLKKAGVDYDGGVKRFLGRASLYEKTLRRFLGDDSFQRLHSAYDAGDDQQLLLDAHEFKGVCGNLSLPTLHSLSDGLVQMLRRGDYTRDELQDAFLKLESNYKTVCEAIIAAGELEQ